MLEVGSTFATRFMLVKQQAKGGTATVYKAFDNATQAIVALKVFESQNISPEVLSEIWFRESQALERLQHPNIVTLLIAGRDETTGLRYIAIEWLDGETLEAKLDDSGPLAWDQFYQNFGLQIVEALTYAFKLNIVHRDLSIGNIFVLPGGGIKIIDFGQAKLDDSIVGKTVSGWKTPPYCPPEDDSGRYSNTRDAFSFCAIAVRALAGKMLKNHDELYEAARHIGAPDHILETIRMGLSWDPGKRPPNIVQLALQLSGDSGAAASEDTYKIAIRCIPNLLEKLQQWMNIDSNGIHQAVIDDLNDTVSVSTLENPGVSNSTSIAVETPTLRLIVDVDADSNSHFVIVGAAQKRFSIDRLYGTDRWMPTVSFSPIVPRTQIEIKQAQSDIRRFYTDFESYLGDVEAPKALGDNIFAEWDRLLQALRHIERTRDAPLKYEDAELSGRRLTVTIINPEDAAEGQIRTISHNGRWVFNGVIESLAGKDCTLYSKWPSVRSDAIPTRGALEMDWRQARVALDRQTDALDKFTKGSTPNDRIRAHITGSSNEAIDDRYKSIDKYFDPRLDEEKKLIASKFLATPDLLLVHGPPGTGKTTLIVELIRQQLAENPNAKILLVSQTHVAIDNVLEKLDRGDSALLPVRIGSGSKGLGERVAHCSVEERGHQLQSKVERATEAYLRARAKEQGVDFDEVLLGLRAIEVLALKQRILEHQDSITNLQKEIDELNEKFKQSKNTVTQEETESKSKARALQLDLDETESEEASLRDQLKVAVDKLLSLGGSAKEIATAEIDGLSEWCELLLGEERAHLRELLELAEQWRLKFGQSDDFHAAIIAMAKIVAGTCIGFCRESAALSTQFDLCIVDEASKATTTELLVPLAQARKAVLVGDHHQLPAVIEHALTQPDLQEEYSLSPDHLEQQLFEALQVALPSAHKAELKTQYRMRRAIGELISVCFYDGKLVSGADVDSREFPNLAFARLNSPVTWIDTDPAQKWVSTEEKLEKSFVNSHEVDCVIGLLLRISLAARNDKSFPSNYSIGVISGYAAQVRAINREIHKRPELDELDVDCDTVHAFQGREVDVCIYSVTRNNPRGDIGFLRDWRHLNVALSRARDYLVIVGGLYFSGMKGGNSPFSGLIEYISDAPESQIVEWDP